MGVWMIGTGSITIKPQVDEAFIREYMQFSKSYFPEEYEGEHFSNTWMFDEENKLFSIAGKFAESSIWYRHIKENFFEASACNKKPWEFYVVTNEEKLEGLKAASKFTKINSKLAIVVCGIHPQKRAEERVRQMLDISKTQTPPHNAVLLIESRCWGVFVLPCMVARRF